jgi:hypothetical protein
MRKLDQAKLVDIGLPSRDSASHVIAWGIKRVPYNLSDWLTETWTKRWPTVKKLEMLHQINAFLIMPFLLIKASISVITARLRNSELSCVPHWKYPKVLPQW